MRLFGASLQNYLTQRGAALSDAEEAIQDFIVKQLEKMKNREKTIHSRLHYWIHVKRTLERVSSFLKACVLHQFIDQKRKRGRTEPNVYPLGDSVSKQFDQRNQKLDPLDYAWAVSLLQVAIHDFKNAQIGDPATSNENPQQAKNGLLNWQIFVERFVSPSIKHLVRGRKFTAQEIGTRLGLSRDQTLYRIQQVRELFSCHLRQAIVDSCPDADSESLFNELKSALIIGGVSLHGLLSEFSDFSAESTIDTMNVFSLASSDSSPGDEVIDLLTPITPSPDAHEERELFDLLMRREYRSSYSNGDSPPETSTKSVEEIIFAEQPSLDDLQMIKSLARHNGQTEHSLLKEVYHVIYALVIARAKNVYNRTITSLSVKDRIYSLNVANSHEWLPSHVSRELELAIRAFAESGSQSSLAP